MFLQINNQIQARQHLIDNDDTAKPEDGSRALDFMEKLQKITGSLPAEEKSRITTGTCSLNITAGSDTTSIARSSIVFNLLQNPRVLGKLWEEIDWAVSNGEASDPITFIESQKLHYLQAVIKEGLRVHSSTGLPMWRVVPADGAIIAGRYFPPGAVVGVNTWVIHQNPEIFKPDPEVFKPERWLDTPKEDLSRMESCFLPFGAGSRTCIGKNISLLEISKLIPELIRKFDMVMDGNGKRDGMVSRSRWFTKPLEFKVRLQRRACKHQV